MSASQFQFYLTTRVWTVKAMLTMGAMVMLVSNLSKYKEPISQVKPICCEKIRPPLRAELLLTN